MRSSQRSHLRQVTPSREEALYRVQSDTNEYLEKYKHRDKLLMNLFNGYLTIMRDANAVLTIILRPYAIDVFGRVTLRSADPTCNALHLFGLGQFPPRP